MFDSVVDIETQFLKIGDNYISRVFVLTLVAERLIFNF